MAVAMKLTDAQKARLAEIVERHYDIIRAGVGPFEIPDRAEDSPDAFIDALEAGLARVEPWN